MEIIEAVPGVQEYVDLRVKAGLSAKSLEAAGWGCPIRCMLCSSG